MPSDRDDSQTTVPRLLPERPLPPYAYHPGRTPHPTRDPAGHGVGAEGEPPAPPEPGAWRACPDYLYGIDLFNHGYYWEAHEAWEGLWVACGRTGTMAAFLQGLINLAATGFKTRLGNVRGVRANAGTAARLFRAAAADLGPAGRHFMGFDVEVLAFLAETWAETGGEAPEAGAVPAFDVVLRPE